MKCPSMTSSSTCSRFLLSLVLLAVSSRGQNFHQFSRSEYGLEGPPSPFGQQPIVRHPGTCTYQRSQQACTFSLLCYLAGGLPIEGCGGDIGMTCCMLMNGGNVNFGQQLAQAGHGPPPPPPPPMPMHHQYPHHQPQHHQQPPTQHHYYHPQFHNAAHHYPSGPHMPPQGQQLPPPHAHASHSFVRAEAPPNQLVHQSAPPPQIQHVAPPQPQMPPPPPASQNFLTAPVQAVPSYEYTPPAPVPVTSPSYDLPLDMRRTVPSISNAITTSDYGERHQYARHLASIEDICGKPSTKPKSRIIGGQDAYFGEFPWQVHIKIAKHQCGGALVNREFIVTAAHCVYQAPLHQLSIIIGAYDIEDHRYQDEKPQYFNVAEVRLHPSFRFSASHPDRYDVAVLRLSKPARYTDNVLPVCLPPKDIQFEGWHGLVTGWGKTDPTLSNRYGTRLLQKVDVPIIKNGECENWHQTRGIDLKIFPEMMCAGYEDGQKDACVGDSGGPLVVFLNGRWTLAGITSAGFGCAQSRQPGIYHRLPMTVDWIASNVS